MIRLSATTQTLELILSAGTADVEVSYSDDNGTTYVGGTQQTAATATTQTICGFPAVSTNRDIDYLSVQFKTTGGVVTVQKTNSSGPVTTQLIKVTLLLGEQLTYTHGTGWTAIDANGNRKEITASIFASITVTGSSSFQATITVKGAGNAYTNGAFIIQDSSGANAVGLLNIGGAIYLGQSGTDFLVVDSTGISTIAGAFTGNVVATGAEVRSNRAIRATGTYTIDAASSILMNYNTGSNQGQFLVEGPDNSTNAEFTIYSTRANGSNALLLIYGTATGEVKFPSIGTTASAANAFLDSGSSNNLLRSTSSAAYKTAIEPIDDEFSDRVLNLKPIWYRSLASADNKDWSWYGLIAEQVAEVEPRLVHWSKKVIGYRDGGRGEPDKVPLYAEELVPDGVQYERISVLLLAKVQQLVKAGRSAGWNV